ncbi:IclR family transcriptional regulator [Ramlibacter tataouinensis]|uniref:Transcriptional regulator, IclR family-like protein n=1 Tax=Ramlibacter tataouinensis (strain ATCC BAA-407 / DSM 14655 / LMG 21543 / TTB310) TaxID=365046 RepID=F5Y1Q5_RAMTT|nr:IclR family transcriptional regulator [Ramlibacter tataouinensis]AEG92306.1 transcriptional regulator, IclR family-like protein [Ramlibacter tataouinensis TTB310]
MASSRRVAAPASPQARAPRPAQDRHLVVALARGLEVLACFRSGALLGNQDIAVRCGLPKSTVSRLTATLTRLGYLIQIGESGKFRLGTATLSLGSAMLSRLDVRQLARPGMEALAAQCKVEVALGARDRLSMIYVEACRSARPPAQALDMGARIPVATTAMGRAWLSAIEAPEREDFLERIRRRDAAAWPALRRGIEGSLHEHRTLGVTCSFGEWLSDINGIACAVRPGEGLPPMAISCGGPAARLSPQYLLGEVRPRLIALAAAIEDAAAGATPARRWAG